MPKISKHKIRIDNDTYRKMYDVEVYYNQEHGFYVVMPPELNDAFDLLSDSERKLYHAFKNYKSNRDCRNGIYKRCVGSTTEDTAVSNAKILIEKLVTSEVKQRNVILVFYKSDTAQYGDHQYNKEHDAIGLQLGLTYCTETKVGEETNYYIYEERDGVFEDKVYKTKRKISIWRNGVTIIDDTKENRVFVESLYKAFQGLIAKLDKFTESKESFLKLISSRQKLLS